MAESVQQIKFAFASYVKEFGADFREWSVGTAEDACRALFEENAVNEASDPWLWKPALTPAAAGMIQTFLERHGAAPARTPCPGPEVFLFRRIREGT